MSSLLIQDKPPSQPIAFVFSQDQDISIPLEERYEIQKCVNWIGTNNYSKVCLQFPDSYLSDSVDVALLIEEQISSKTFILGDTSYGSCCIDIVAAQHVEGDAVIHFGHTCLTCNSNIPVLYVLPKRALDLSTLNNGHKSEIKGSLVIIYDIGYHHLSARIRECFSGENIIIPELIIDEGPHSLECCQNCLIKTTGRHKEVRFNRGFCLLNGYPDNFIYIGSENDPAFTNFIYHFKDSQAFYYSNGSLVAATTLRLFKQISYYTEEIKAAGCLTIVLVSLSISGYLESISHIKALAKRWNKKVYVISIAKPNIAKLTNFPEMEIFVVIGCPETHLINNKEIIQPVVGLMEVELALNENRGWKDTFSKDFRDLIPGGKDYISVPESLPEGASNVSNITGRLGGQTMSGDIGITDIAINSNKSLVSTSMKTGGKQERTWFGLKQSLGETPVSLALLGRSGTSTGYSDEPQGENGTESH